MTYMERLARADEDLGPLLEQRDAPKGKQGRDYAEYRDDPIGFTRDVLHVNLWASARTDGTGQIDIVHAVRDHDLVSVRGANALGKDTAAACLALWWYATRPGSDVLITGPTDRQVREIVFGREIRRAFMQSDLPGKLFSTTLRGLDGRRILGFVSSGASQMSGFHGDVLAIVTEGQGVEDFAYEAVMSWAPQKVLVVGNPLAPTGRFYAQHRAGSQWKWLRISAFDHPNVATGTVVIKGGVTRTDVERIKREYGESSPQYVARVNGEFPAVGANAVVTPEQYDAAVARWEARRKAGAEDTRTLVVAIDPAGGGDDSAARADTRGSVVERVSLLEYSDTSLGYTRQVNRTLRAEGFTPASDLLLVVDANGVGWGVASELEDVDLKDDGLPIGGWPLERFLAQERDVLSDEERKQYANRRAKAYWIVKQTATDGTLMLPPDEFLREELLATTWFVNLRGQTQILGKDELRRDLGRSPDRADAVAMGLAMSAGDGFAGIGGQVISM